MTQNTRDQRQLVFEKMLGKNVAGKYTISGLLGFGGMGAVYEAVQAPMERKVALKLIPTFDPTATTRFEREATTVSKLSHPNTVTVFDFGQTEDGHLYLSMEHLTGHTLTDLIKREHPLSPERIVHIATQICRALGEAHRIGIIHRDIKPDNIFLIKVDKDPDYVKVLDFGIAKAIHGEESADLTADGRIIGTPRYMSPEQILANPIDHRVDIYSLGCIIFEMICGTPPFGGNNTAALMMSHAQQRPPTFSERLTREQLQQLPAGLESVVQRTLAKSANARPQNTDELRKELEQALRINQAYQMENNPGQYQPSGQYQPPHAFGQPTGQHTRQTGQHFTAEPFTAEPFTGSFEHNTGNFTHQTGGFNQQPQFANPHTGQFTGQHAQPAQSKSKTPIIIGLFLVLGIVGLAVAFAMSNNDGDKKTNNLSNKTVQNKTQDKVDNKIANKTQVLPRTEEKTIPPAVKKLKFRVRTSPSEADIFDGTRFVASTPHTLELMANSEKKTYTIKLKKYKTAKITINPTKPDENFFDIDLIPNTSKRKQARVKVRRTKDNDQKSENSGSKTNKENKSAVGTSKVDNKGADKGTDTKTTKKTEPKKEPVIKRLDDDTKGTDAIDRLP